MGDRLYKDCCKNCEYGKIRISFCHVWTFVCYDGQKEGCDNKPLTEKERKELFEKGGTIKQ